MHQASSAEKERATSLTNIHVGQVTVTAWYSVHYTLPVFRWYWVRWYWVLTDVWQHNSGLRWLTKLQSGLSRYASGVPFCIHTYAVIIHPKGFGPSSNSVASGHIEPRPIYTYLFTRRTQHHLNTGRV